MSDDWRVKIDIYPTGDFHAVDSAWKAHKHKPQKYSKGNTDQAVVAEYNWQYTETRFRLIKQHVFLYEEKNKLPQRNQSDVFLIDFLAAGASDAARIFGVVRTREAL